MVTFGIRLIRAACIAALLTLGLLVAPIGQSTAVARPYSGGPASDPTGTGDPTGDDLPSPTPKPAAPGRLQAGNQLVANPLGTRFGGWTLSERLSLFARIVLRLGIH
jgi:hypothetical protein